MNHTNKFDFLAIVGFLNRMDGLDFINGAHEIPKMEIQWSGLFCKYLKIYEESTADFWCTIRFRHSKRD